MRCEISGFKIINRQQTHTFYSRSEPWIMSAVYVYRRCENDSCKNLYIHGVGNYANFEILELKKNWACFFFAFGFYPMVYVFSSICEMLHSKLLDNGLAYVKDTYSNIFRIFCSKPLNKSLIFWTIANGALFCQLRRIQHNSLKRCRKNQ